MLHDEFCPDCGTPRAALFRFCLDCGLDFDALDLAYEPPGGPYSPVPPNGWPQAGFVLRPRSAPAKIRGRRGERGTRPDKRGQPDGMPASRRQPNGWIVIAVSAILGLGAVTLITNPDLPRTVGANIDALAGALASDIALLGAGPTALAVAPSIAPETPAPIATPTPSLIPPILPEMKPGPRAVAGTVMQVFDGNTILVDVAGTFERVRYLDVVIPSGTPDADAVAIAATKLNRSLVGDHTVLLEPDVSDSDDAGRLLRHVWVEEDGRYLLVGTWLVLSGVAETEFIEPDLAYQEVYVAAQDYARKQAIGIWGTTTAELPETGGSPDPGAGPTPGTSFRTYTSTEPVIVFEGTDTKLEGTLGRFVWRSVAFYSPLSRISWNVSSTRRTGCRLDWHVEPGGAGTPITLAIPIQGIALAKGSQELDTATGTAMVIVESTCPVWTLSLRGLAP